MPVKSIKDKIEVIELDRNVSNTLSELIISDTFPGTIISDFEAFIDIVKNNEVLLATSQKSVTVSQLHDINKQLPTQWEVSLKRPLQKSFPNIHGLFLLLRCSGIFDAKKENRKTIISINPTIYTSWLALSAEEKYLNLLRVWLLHAHPEVIGERGDNFRIIRNVLWFILDILSDKEKDYTDRNDELSGVPELYNLLLCKMFGFIEIKLGEKKSAKDYGIVSITRTPVGKAFMSLILRVTLSDRWYAFAYEAESAEVFKRWQAYFKPYFENWKNNLVSETANFRKGLHIFKVEIQDAWRKIAILGDATLDNLCVEVLKAFDFDNDHLYSLEIKNRFGITVSYSHPYTEDIPSTTDKKLGEIDLKIGDTFEFIYDFGSNWEFRITFEDLKPLPTTYTKPYVVAKSGKAPEQYGDLFGG